MARFTTTHPPALQARLDRRDKAVTRVLFVILAVCWLVALMSVWLFSVCVSALFSNGVTPLEIFGTVTSVILFANGGFFGLVALFAIINHLDKVGS